MTRKILSYALLLLGVGALVMSLAQANQMMITSAQSDISKPLLEAQIQASEEQARALGQSDADIAATSRQARSIVEQSVSKINQSYQTTLLLDLVLGLVFVSAGIFVHPRDH